MRQRLWILMGVIFMASGCTATSQNQSLVSQLQYRVGDLERQLEVKDDKIKDLEFEVKDLSYDIKKLRSTKKSYRTSSLREEAEKAIEEMAENDEIIRVDVSTKKVQIALKKAGYYKGTIDSKIGTGTKAAISRFQKDHGLEADGIIGKKTWSELKDYLE